MQASSASDNINYTHRFATIGGFIGEIDERGKGYGTEALTLISDYAFNVLNLRFLLGDIFSFNKASIKSILKVGYKQVGQVKDYYYYRGEYFDRLQFQITKEEFYSLHPTHVLPV